jgi:hypothetical protein
MRQSITGRALKLAATLIILLVAVISSSFIANNALAIGGRHTRHENTLKGEVVAVDTLHHINMLTLQSYKIGQFPNDQLNIFMNKNTSVNICSERKPEHDIKVSRDATVTYHEVQGLLPLADSVSEKC